jgi:hypothetical protein
MDEEIQIVIASFVYIVETKLKEQYRMSLSEDERDDLYVYAGAVVEQIISDAISVLTTQED